MRKSFTMVFRRLWISSKNRLTDSGIDYRFCREPFYFYFSFPFLVRGFSGPNSAVRSMIFFLRKLFYLLSCLISSIRNSSLSAELISSSLWSRGLMGVSFAFLVSAVAGSRRGLLTLLGASGGGVASPSDRFGVSFFFISIAI